MTKYLIRATGVALVSGLMVMGLSAVAQANIQSNGSTAALYLYQGDATTRADGGTLNADSTVYSSSSATDGSASFNCTGSGELFTFLALDGDAFVKANWKASLSKGSANLGAIAVVDMSFADMSNGGVSANSPSSLLSVSSPTTVKYSYGLACVNNDGNTVDKAFYRTLTSAANGNATVEAVADNLPTPTISGTLAKDATLTANLVSPPTTGYTISYQWYRASSAIATNGTSSTYVITNDDGYNQLSVKVTYTPTPSGTPVVKTSAATALVTSGITATTRGSETLTAKVANSVDGGLVLSVASAAVTFGAASLVDNVSVSTGNLANVTIQDARFKSHPGWTLAADVTSFVKGSETIFNTALGSAPTIVSAPSQLDSSTHSYAGTATVAGEATYPMTSFASADNSEIVGNTVIGGTLTFKAPQYRSAGDYVGTMTLTVTTK